MSREFDLNIEKVLENWEVYHGIREIIANALDEQALTDTQKIAIFKDNDGRWHLRDYGRGLQYLHFTQNENQEKLTHPNLIGKFGVGLKDALATFDRHGVGVEINSRYGHYTTKRACKHGFMDLMTLHVRIDDPLDSQFVGTEFILTGCEDDDITQAKALFLQYADLELLDDNHYGQIYKKRNGKSEIFVNGIKVAEEENFLFSYNITSPNAALKKAINRERINVGRGAYSDRVKDLLLKASSPRVVDEFVENLDQLSGGEQSDELRWKDVQVHFLQTLSKNEDVVFLTSSEADDMNGRTKEIVDDSSKRKVFVSDAILETLKEKAAIDEDFELNTVSSVVRDYNLSFEYKFVDSDALTATEREIFSHTPQVVQKIFPEFNQKQIFISETMRPSDNLDDTLGICDQCGERIIILREVLGDKSKFLGVLAHELVHAKTGYCDCSRAFETALTEEIGNLLATCANI